MQGRGARREELLQGHRPRHVHQQDGIRQDRLHRDITFETSRQLMLMICSAFMNLRKQRGGCLWRQADEGARRSPAGTIDSLAADACSLCWLPEGGSGMRP